MILTPTEGEKHSKKKKEKKKRGLRLKIGTKWTNSVTLSSFDSPSPADSQTLNSSEAQITDMNVYQKKVRSGQGRGTIQNEYRAVPPGNNKSESTSYLSRLVSRIILLDGTQNLCKHQLSSVCLAVPFGLAVEYEFQIRILKFR
jgi:hypothetical protein